MVRHGLAQPVSGAHGEPSQFCEATVAHSPFPLQVAIGVKVPSALQLALAHTRLVPTLRHAPSPSQVPSLPHGLLAVSSSQ
jgi:hypothetical protein